MDLHIICVSRRPEAPTRVPATMSRLLFKVKPEAATARPVKEFNREINTGTSAPPMGSTTKMPTTKETASSTHISAVVGCTKMATISAIDAKPRIALTICWPG
jgi:hypothetical protein